MERASAIYTSALIELLLREDPSTCFGKARKEFIRFHGTFGLEQLSNAEKSLRREFQLPDC